MRKFWRTKPVEPEEVPDVKKLFFEVDPSIRERIEALAEIASDRTKAREIIIYKIICFFLFCFFIHGDQLT